MIFLVFEGLDGSGKSSLMLEIEKHLTSVGKKTYRTREPGGTILGDEIRQMILRKAPPHPTARTELLLYEASRAQHVDEVIVPKLREGFWILCDRFTASSVAFQAGGREITEATVVMLNEFACHGVKPHLTILLDLPVEAARQRQSKRSAETGEAQDRIEAEANNFHERVRKSFLKQAKDDFQNWLVLDASTSTQEMATRVIEALKEKAWL